MPCYSVFRMMISLFERKAFPVKFRRESVCKILKLLRELTSKIGKSIEKGQNSLLFSLFSGNSRRSGIAILFPPATHPRHFGKTTKRNCPGTPPNRCRTELLSDDRFGFVHDTIHLCSRRSRRPRRIEASSKLKKRGTWAVTAKRNTPKKARKFNHLQPPSGKPKKKCVRGPSRAADGPCTLRTTMLLDHRSNLAVDPYRPPRAAEGSVEASRMNR
jgi:hypothetical protein